MFVQDCRRFIALPVPQALHNQTITIIYVDLHACIHLKRSLFRSKNVRMIEKLLLNILVQYQFRSNILRIIEKLTMNNASMFCKICGS